MNDIDTSLIPDFVAEAVEHLEEMESGLLKIEADSSNVELLNGIFRNIHTIKGAAQFVGLKQTSHLSHSAENLLDLLRSGSRACTPSVVDVLIQVKDRLGQLMREVESTQNEQILVDDLVASIVAHIENREPAAIIPVSIPRIESQATITRVTDESDIEPVSIKTASAIPLAPHVDAVGDDAVENQETEIYTEELDQELFAIFTHQLSEEIVNLHALLEQAQAATAPGPFILDCITSLEKLKSSANYMGYESLIDLYDAWIRSLYGCIETNNPDWEVMNRYFERIAQRFPKLDLKIPNLKSDVVAILKPSVMPKVVSLQPQAVLKSPVIQQHTVPTTQQTTSDTLLSQLTAALEHKSVSASTIPTATTFDMDVAFEELNEIVEEPSAISAAPIVLSEPMEEEMIGEEEELPVEKTIPRAVSGGKEESKDKKDSNERNLKRSVRVDAEKIDLLMNQVGELIVHRSYFNQIHNDLIAIQRRLEVLGLDAHETKALRSLAYRYSEAIVSLSRTANELQEGVMKVRMLPISQLFNRYPRLVHDLVRHSDKKVRLEIRGEDTELDKMIIEEVSDPLIHVIRNAVDHGFESAAERKRLGKPEIGTLLLDAYHESNHIVIKITDDGRGIDHHKVGNKALEKGLITEVELERMTPREIIRLIMQPGFSTAETITSTSGRGVGMDVVRKNIEKLNGSIEIDSEVGHGSRFRFKIPLTLAIISALQVRVGETYFTVPLANVEETLRVFAKDLSVIEGIEVIQLRGHTMPIFRLDAIFNIRSDYRNGGRMFVVVVNTGNEKVGLVVDALLGQDEVVIKPLIDYLQEKSGFSGATIIGGGRISLILDVYELVKMTAYKQARMQHQFTVRRRQQMNPSHATAA